MIDLSASLGYPAVEDACWMKGQRVLGLGVVVVVVLSEEEEEEIKWTEYKEQFTRCDIFEEDGKHIPWARHSAGNLHDAKHVPFFAQ